MPTIRQRRHYECIYDDDNIVDQVLRSVSTYNDTGQILEHNIFSPEGEIIQAETSVYENGLLKATSLEDMMNDATQRTEFTYDGDRISTQREYFNEVDFIETRHEYDEQYRPVAIRKEDNDAISQGYVLFEYPDERTVESEYNEDGELVSRQEYVRNENGNRIQNYKTTYNGRQRVVVKEVVEYRGKDEISTVRRYRDDTLIFEAENEYDESGRIVKTSLTDHLNARGSEQVFIYDDADRIAREEYFEGGHLMQVHEMLYDANGEVVEETYSRRLYEDYFQPATQRFEIEYFDH